MQRFSLNSQSCSCGQWDHHTDTYTVLSLHTLAPRNSSREELLESLEGDRTEEQSWLWGPGPKFDAMRLRQTLLPEVSKGFLKGFTGAQGDTEMDY